MGDVNKKNKRHRRKMYKNKKQKSSEFEGLMKKVEIFRRNKY